MSKKIKSSLPTKRQTESVNPQPSAVAHVTHHQFSGPLPPPEVIDQYNQIIPGAAERILAMAEQDAIHQREIENAAMTLTAEEMKRGQLYGFIIGVFAFTTCIVALLLGSEKTAIVLGSTTVVGLVSVFVTGRFSSKEGKGTVYANPLIPSDDK